jgi:hypothetical protein
VSASGIVIAIAGASAIAVAFRGPDPAEVVDRGSLPVIDVEVVRELSDLGASRDVSGLAASGDGTQLVVARRSDPARLEAYDPAEVAVGAVSFEAPLVNQRAFAHEPPGPAVLAVVRGATADRAEIVRVSGDAPGEAVVLGSVDPRNFSGGLAVDRSRNRLHAVGGGDLLTFQLGDEGAVPGRLLGRTDIEELVAGPPRGVAVDPGSGDVYVADGETPTVVRFDDRGVPADVLDLSAAGGGENVDIAVAPSTDATDDPSTASLYLVSEDRRSGETAVHELTTAARPVADSGRAIDRAELRQEIDLGTMDPPTPDPAGITWLPGSQQLLVSDSEIDERAGFGGTNLRHLGVDGGLHGSSSTTAWSREPSGIALDPGTGHVYSSDDDLRRIFEIDPAEDGVVGTPDDRVLGAIDTTRLGSTDPEDVTYDAQRRALHVADGANRQVFTVRPGPDGAFGTEDDTASQFDVGDHGILDPEGIVHDAENDTLIVIDRRRASGAEFGPDGGLLRHLDLSAAGSGTRLAGATWAPASSGDGRSLWVVDRGVDDPSVSDGRLLELGIPPLGGGSPTGDVAVQPLLDFGDVGENSAVRREAVVRNRGTAPLTVSSVDVEGADRRNFSVAAGAAFVVPPGRSVPVAVTFTPDRKREFRASLSVRAEASDRSVSVRLAGRGVEPEPRVSVTPPDLYFGSSSPGAVARRDITVSNRGTAPLDVRSLSVAGRHREAFSVVDPSPRELPVGESASYTVRFSPTGAGSHSARLVIRSDDARRPAAVIRLSGRGSDGRSTVAVERMDSGVSTQSASVGTADVVDVEAGRLYVAFVASRPAVPVRAVEGLGSPWSAVTEQCSGRSQTGISVFVTTSATAASRVVASFGEAVTTSALTVIEVAGADLAQPIGPVVRTNTAGGSCAGGTDSASWSMTVEGTRPSTLVLGGLATRNRTQVPAIGTATVTEVTSGTAGATTGLSVVGRLGASDSPATRIAGALDGDTDWAGVAVSINPRP